MRLDAALAARGLARSRSHAADLIRRGLVLVDGRPQTKPAAMVGPEADIALAAAEPHVSRGALKLIAALDHFGFDPAGRFCLDAGASTGGFTQILLGRGARRVAAVDVGHGQLHPDLRADPRVQSLEGVDARALRPDMFDEPFGAVAADVSFISLLKVLPFLLPLAAPGAWFIGLVKPQFEAGPALRDGRGVVRDEAAREGAVASVAAFLSGRPGWRTARAIASPLTGRDGNREYLIGAIRDDG
jgi:23S rRNA (cytidine1920-2'-O)/16S rRNA (cytidine1409-2'-O)-methyltransferase